MIGVRWNRRAAYHCGMMRDRVRFEVADASRGDGADDDFDPVAGELQVRIFCVLAGSVDEVELTERGAGLGMGPFDLLLPEIRLVATREARSVPVARCICGTYGCAMTDAVIVRDGDAVRWDWEHEAPIDRPLVFDAAQYDAEVARIGTDRSWERREDTAARRVLELVDHERLAASGMRIEFSGPPWDRPERYGVCLRLVESGDRQYQVFVSVLWSGDPERAASDVRELLAEPPAGWEAGYSAVTMNGPARPQAAGTAWIQGGF